MEVNKGRRVTVTRVVNRKDVRGIEHTKVSVTQELLLMSSKLLVPVPLPLSSFAITRFSTIVRFYKRSVISRKSAHSTNTIGSDGSSASCGPACRLRTAQANMHL